MRSTFVKSEIKELVDLAGDVGHLIVEGEHREEHLAVSTADFHEIALIFEFGEGNQRLERTTEGLGLVVGEEQWHVPEGTEFAVRQGSVEEAVLSKSQVAAAATND